MLCRAAVVSLIALALVACGGGSTTTDSGIDAMDVAGSHDTAMDVPSGPICTTDIQCSDGVFCNGAERCAPSAPAANTRGCIAGIPPCTAMQTCTEATQMCMAASCAHPDADGDGHSSIACGGDDCDDTDANRYPGNTEVCTFDTATMMRVNPTHDEDCNPTTFSNMATQDGDHDGDAYIDSACCNGTNCGNDCADTVSVAGVPSTFMTLVAPGEIHPMQAEVCNGVDDNCNGHVDEGLPEVTYYPDCDGDGSGDAAAPGMTACSEGALPLCGGHQPVANDVDCNDGDAAVGVCVAPAMCQSGYCNPFASTGAEGAFAPTASMVLPAGEHDFTTINIPVGVTITTNGTGVLDLRATGAVVIAGAIDVSGGAGLACGGAGATGSHATSACSSMTGGGPFGGPIVYTGGAGGSGGVSGRGGDGATLANGAGAGGAFGGGGGAAAVSGETGGGGGGPGGGAGAGINGGFGASTLGGAGGGPSGGAAGCAACRTGVGSSGNNPAGSGGSAGDGNYNGVDGAAGNSVAGGGSIGLTAASDLAIATTFYPGSGGGGCTEIVGTGFPPPTSPGGGGGGGGGALRITSAVTITVSGTLAANGGAGGPGAGGGSGGAIYVSAPAVTLGGFVSAVAGAGGSGGGGAGGLGRIRLSVLPAMCTVSGTLAPPLAAGCVASAPGGMSGRTYVGVFPN